MLSHFLLFSTFRLCCSLLLGTDINQNPDPTNTPAPTGTFRPLIEVTATPTLQGTPNYECPADPWLAYHDMIENNLTPGGSFNLSCQTCIQYALLTATARAYTPTPATPGAMTPTPSPSPTPSPTPLAHTYSPGPWEYFETYEPGNGYPYSYWLHEVNIQLLPNRMVGYLLKVSPESKLINGTVNSYFGNTGYVIDDMSSYQPSLIAGTNYCVGFNTGPYGEIGSLDDLDAWCPEGYVKRYGTYITESPQREFATLSFMMRELTASQSPGSLYAEVAIVYEDYNPNPQQLICQFPEIEEEDDIKILPEISIGEAVCMTIAGLDLDLSGLSWLTGWDNASFTIPGFEVCVTPVHFGELWLFGLIINLDALVTAVTAIALIRWWIYS